MRTQKSRYFEIVAVLFTAVGKFIIFDGLQKQFWFIITASIFWLGYIVYYLLNDRDQLIHWGFRKEGFRESLRLILPIAVIAVFLFFTYGFLTRRIILSWHIFPSLLLYPFWGIAQQFIILALIAGNLDEMDAFRLPKFLIILITALLFCLVHFPNYYLMGSTFILALVYTAAYLKHRNLWVLGILHGWLGSFFYFFVLGKDAWLKFIHSI